MKTKKCTTVIPHAERYQIQLRFVRRQENLHQWEAPAGAPFLVIGPRSPEPWRQEVERLAYNFKREMHFDFPPYTANESDHDRKPCHDRVLVFSKDIIMTEDIFFIGAIGFRLEERPDRPPYWCATWAWLHPYERERGHLTKAWPFLLRMFPTPHMEQPVSRAMNQFLKKIGYLHLRQGYGGQDDGQVAKCGFDLWPSYQGWSRSRTVCSGSATSIWPPVLDPWLISCAPIGHSVSGCADRFLNLCFICLARHLVRHSLGGSGSICDGGCSSVAL